MSSWRWVAPRLPTLALIALGLAGLYVASSLEFGTPSAPGSGFFPTIVCLLIAIFGAAALASPEESTGDPEGGESGGQVRIWVVVAALAAYTWMLEPVGFLLTTTALLLLLLRGIGAVRWAAAAPAAVIGAATCFWGFTRLGVPLPAGILAF
jgi:putative tricarboxylic transport membrane protein